MPPDRITSQPGTGRAYDRFVNFSDAVVAIAITLLGLALVDIPAPSGTSTAWSVLTAHTGQLTAFGYTFLVVATEWAAHHRVFGAIRAVDRPLLWLNMLFLFAIVLLPFPSGWVGEEGFEAGIGPFYLLTLALASGSLGLIGRHAARRPHLLDPAARPGGARPISTRRSVLFTSFFAAMAVLAVPWPDLTSYLMLALIPLAVLEQRLARRGLGGTAAGAADAD